MRVLTIALIAVLAGLAALTAQSSGELKIYVVDVEGGGAEQVFDKRDLASGAAGLKLSVYKEGFFSSLGKALGTQDIQVGDPLFDDLFMVKSNDESLCRAWLNAGVWP